MILLADAAVAVGQVPIDAPAAGDGVAIVRARERGPLGDAEVGFDGIEPRRVGGSPHRLNPKPAEQGQEAGMIVHVPQIIHDDEQSPAWVARAQTPEGLADFDDPLAPTEHATETIGVDIVEPQKLLGAVGAPIGGPHAQRPPAPAPGDPAQRPQFQGPPLVEANHRRPRRTRLVELADTFFFRSNAGSSEVFQVRMRWACSPSRRRSRRTHSSVIGGRTPRCRQYSASLGTVQAAKGRPRSAGLDSAMSINSRTWGPVMIGGRPCGLDARSNVVKPLSLNRCTHSYAMVTAQPTRSAASAIERPLATSAITRYRRCRRTDRRRSPTFACSTRRSPRLNARSRTDLAMLSLLADSVDGGLQISRHIKLDRH